MELRVGQCHCQNISYQLCWPEDEVMPARACGCSFCQMHGGVYTSHTKARLEATLASPELVSLYTQGTQTASFYVCMRCGVVPFVTSDIDGRLYAVVNVNTLVQGETTEPSVTKAPAEARGTSFDHETQEERLRRRQRSWIPNVVLSQPAVLSHPSSDEEGKA